MSNDLTIIEQRSVNFYADILTAIRADDGNVYASIRQMCTILGIDTQAQRRRIGRHAILADGQGVANLATPSGVQATNVLRVDLIPFWLSGIRAKAVGEAIRPKLELLQKNAARLLWQAFQSGELTADSDVNELLQNASPETAETYQIAKAVYQMARRQLVTEARLNDHEMRLQLLEARSGDTTRYIDNRQASMISQAVKAIALELGRRSGRNEFGGIYGELYRRYEISDYRALPAVRFAEAIKFLADWYSSLTGSEIAF